MQVLNDVLGYKNLKIYQDLDFFCFSLDSVMLANFVTIRLRDKNICDLCTGNGIIPLILTKRTNNKIVGIEIQKKLSLLAEKSVKYNNLTSQIEILNYDVTDNEILEKYNEYFDIVTCNPPFFKVGEKSYLNLNEEKKIARHEIKINLEKLFIVVKKILKNNGNFAMVHRPDRLVEIINLMSKNGIQPKRIQFVYDKLGKKSKLLLIEGQKCGNLGLTIEEPFILNNDNGDMTEQYKKIIVEVRK